MDCRRYCKMHQYRRCHRWNSNGSRVAVCCWKTGGHDWVLGLWAICASRYHCDVPRVFSWVLLAHFFCVFELSLYLHNIEKLYAWKSTICHISYKYRRRTHEIHQRCLHRYLWSTRWWSDHPWDGWVREERVPKQRLIRANKGMTYKLLLSIK